MRAAKAAATAAGVSHPCSSSCSSAFKPNRARLHESFFRKRCTCSMIAAGQNDTPATAAVAEDLVLHRILQQFEGRAATYDANNTYHPALAQNLLQLLALKPGDRLLDLAAGTGIVALAAAAAVAPGGNVVLVDISPAMLQQARSKYTAAVQLGDSNVESSTAQCAIQPQDTGEREQQLLSQRQQQQQQQLAPAHFILGDIEQLHSCLPAEWLHSFSAITCSAAVPFLQQPTAALASWRHWLQQPGGKLAFNAFVPPAIEDYGTFIRLAGECAFPAEFDPSEVLGSTERVTAALTEAGYSRIQASCRNPTLYTAMLSTTSCSCAGRVFEG